MTTYTIRTRGLIPGILKRGPMSGIELSVPTLVDLLSRGVDIVDDSTGRPVQMMDVIAPKKKVESVPSVTDTVPSVTDSVPEEIPPQEPEQEPAEEPTKEGEFTEEEPVDEDNAAKKAAPEEELPTNGEETKEPEAEAAEATAPAQEPQVPAAPSAPDPYAGMSKNQRKKAQQRAAAAAKAAANGNAGTQN